MNPKEELFERFGKELIDRVRDNQIHYFDAFIEQKAPLSREYKEELDGLSPAQMEMLEDLIVQ